MIDTKIKLDWEKGALAKYSLMITKIPLFHREIAKKVVDKRAAINAQDRGANEVQEQDIIHAFFSEVPMTFYSLMVRLMNEVGFDYKKFEPR